MAEKQLPVNEQITADSVHLIMENGQSAGTISLDQARYLAQQYELDLVELNANARPPIVRLLDYNKYRYQQEKNARSGSLKQRSNEMKEIRLSFKIDAHDLEIKAKRVQDFLEQGSFVRVYTQLRGRENIFADKAKKNLEGFGSQIGADVEKAVNQTGKRVEIILKPKRK